MDTTAGDAIVTATGRGARETSEWIRRGNLYEQMVKWSGAYLQSEIERAKAVRVLRSVVNGDKGAMEQAINLLKRYVG
jgi:hypothetical protein